MSEKFKMIKSPVTLLIHVRKEQQNSFSNQTICPKHHKRKLMNFWDSTIGITDFKGNVALNFDLEKCLVCIILIYK